MALKGRHWVAIWLLVALVTLWIVAARQAAAYREATALRVARAERARLEGRKADLERRVRAAQSRAALVPLAQRSLQLRLPADSEIVLLPGRTR